MAADARDAFAQQFAALLGDSRLQAKQIVEWVNSSRPSGAMWSVTPGLLSAWKTGRNLPSEANKDGFFRAVRLLTEHARKRALRGHPVGKLLDEVAWTRMLELARAAPLADAAERDGIALYLKMLTKWMNSDPWPRDRRFDGPVLTPAVIERKLRVAVGTMPLKDFDADELIQKCHRLVVMGGPGSGKTWLAKRAVRRCAENALQALAAGATLDEIELPLYTTCSRLFGADGDIRQAIVSSALDQFVDIGGSQSGAALRSFFTERNRPTLLVIDSLDEAHGSSERLRQADTLPWRILLTGRPSSWRNQLTIDDTDESHRIGELQPLEYPDDVVPFIQNWFAERPRQGRDLAAQIARRPGLQQAATVPLILAFYCIIGDGGPLPEFRRDLYTRVLNRMLTGRWRDDRDRQPDVDICLRTLRTWAWSGASGNHSISGVGMWPDDVPTGPVRLSGADADALDHIATPVALPDVDTRETLRRFIHRSIREHLVAEQIASLPADQAVEVLLPHLWYDPDWEYTAPAAIAMHSQRDQVLRNLISRAAQSNQIPDDICVIDALWEFRRLLARIAVESQEADWSPRISQVIGDARVQLGQMISENRYKLRQSAPFADLVGAAHWKISNRQVRDSLLSLLAGQTDCWMAAKLAGGVMKFDPTEKDRHQAYDVLLGLLAKQADNPTSFIIVADLIDSLIHLNPSEEGKRRVREALLGLLAREGNGRMAAQLAGEITHLDATENDKHAARQAFLGLLALQNNGLAAKELASAVMHLDPTEENRRQAREALLDALARENDSPTTADLITKVVKLAMVEADMTQFRNTLLEMLTRDTGRWKTKRIVAAVVRLATTETDKSHVRETMLDLARETDSWRAREMMAGLTQLAVTEADKRRIRERVLEMLVHEANGVVASELVSELVKLEPSPKDERRACDLILRMLARESSSFVSCFLADGLVRLRPTPEDKRQARHALLKLMNDDADGFLDAALVHLDPTVHDLGPWHSWAVPPTTQLLIAARRNSPLPVWLAALPSLAE
jgi:hypothetical protein